LPNCPIRVPDPESLLLPPRQEILDAEISFSSCSWSCPAFPIKEELFPGRSGIAAAAIRLCICNCIGTWMMQCWHVQTAIPLSLSLHGACWSGPMIAATSTFCSAAEGKGKGKGKSCVCMGRELLSLTRAAAVLHGMAWHVRRETESCGIG
jgi:hypothetical protein